MFCDSTPNYYYTRLGTSGDVMINKPDKQTSTSEFESQRVMPYSFGLVPHQSKKAE